MTKDLFGISFPAIVTQVERPVRQWIEGSHMVLAYVLAVLVVIHIIVRCAIMSSSATTCCGG